jgi:hypothetical protein
MIEKLSGGETESTEQARGKSKEAWAKSEERRAKS